MSTAFIIPSVLFISILVRPFFLITIRDRTDREYLEVQISVPPFRSSPELTDIMDAKMIELFELEPNFTVVTFSLSMKYVDINVRKTYHHKNKEWVLLQYGRTLIHFLLFWAIIPYFSCYTALILMLVQVSDF